MAFRKRNIGIASRSQVQDITTTDEPISKVIDQFPGLRPSSLDGRATTSTGTASLDAILAGHGGLVMGNSLLIEENGTTDFSGSLLKFFAAEGIAQGHKVVVVGSSPGWEKDLPGLSDDSESQKDAGSAEKMKLKIAWRYERLGEADDKGKRVKCIIIEASDPFLGSTAVPDRLKPTIGQPHNSIARIFCHSFDLRLRLKTDPSVAPVFINLSVVKPEFSPFTSVIERLDSILRSAPTSVVRILIPSFLSPALYSSNIIRSHYILQFVQSLQAVLQRYKNRVVAMLTLPLTLFPRENALVKWTEILSDGIVELTPFPHSVAVPESSGIGDSQEEQPHGMIKMHRLPAYHENGGTAGIGLEDDYVFTLTRKKFLIKRYSLPPLEGDTAAQQGHADETKKDKMDF
jgi:elongator complex protein 4